MTLGEKIHTLRIQHGMTMEIGVQLSAVNKYEKGIVVNLKRSTLVSLCRVFGVQSSYFLDDDPELTQEESLLVTLYRGADHDARRFAVEILENHQKKDTSSEAK